jgi:hypothetical protein
MTIKGFHKRVSSINIDLIIDDSFIETTDDLLEINKDQLLHGMTNTGEKITPVYFRDEYAAEKNQMNSLPGYGTPDLKLTGAFHNEIRIDYKTGVLSSHSNDEKADELEFRYQNIYGLGGPFKAKYLDSALWPAFKNGITAHLGLKFKGK